jgi:hypothetical protein
MPQMNQKLFTIPFGDDTDQGYEPFPQTEILFITATYHNIQTLTPHAGL